MHILGFAWGLMDKTDACTLKKNLPVMSVRDDEGWRKFVSSVNSGKGVFLMCTHVGMIGVLPGLPESLEKCGRSGVLSFRIPKVHAFQQMGHDAVFMKVFMEHFDASKLQLHAVEEIGVETAVEMKEAIDNGEIVIMAGDRVSAGSKSVLKHQFMGRECVWPKGVYRFAKLMESPVFAVTCISTGWNRYEVHFAALEQNTASMLDGFVGFLERETVSHPAQWYQFYDFFKED
jgi:predicted LPLAT superfamily acyltransferase